MSSVQTCTPLGRLKDEGTSCDAHRNSRRDKRRVFPLSVHHVPISKPFFHHVGMQRGRAEFDGQDIRPLAKQFLGNGQGIDGAVAKLIKPRAQRRKLVGAPHDLRWRRFLPLVLRLLLLRQVRERCDVGLQRVLLRHRLGPEIAGRKMAAGDFPAIHEGPDPADIIGAERHGSCRGGIGNARSGNAETPRAASRFFPGCRRCIVPASRLRPVSAGAARPNRRTPARAIRPRAAR